MDVLPRKVTKRIINRKVVDSSMRASGLCVRAAPPSVTSASARNRATRSSDLRQKMSVPTTKEVAAKISWTEIRYPAKKPTERPIAPSSRMFAGVRAPGWHEPLVHTAWSRANSAGMLTTIQTTVSTATTVHTTRARVKERPPRGLAAGDTAGGWLAPGPPVGMSGSFILLSILVSRGGRCGQACGGGGGG